MGRDQGLTDRHLTELADYETSDAFDDVDRAVLRYADAMTDTPVHVPESLFAALREYLDDEALVELTSAFAWENYRARFDHAMGIEAEGFSEGRVCALPARDGAHEDGAGGVR